MKNETPAAQADNSALARFVAALTIEGAKPELMRLTTDGEAKGLPASVPVIFDRSAQRPLSVKALVEEYRIRPERRQGTAKVNTLASLIGLTKRHAVADQSALFAETRWPKPAITAVIDYHAVDHEPGWQKHRVHYDFPLTEEFQTWVKFNRKPLEQADFAAFLEEHAAELVSPLDAERTEYERIFKEKFAGPAELITLSRELEVYLGAKVKRGERLQTGEKTVEFTSEHTNGRGEKIEIPGIFVINVPVFIDGEPVRIIARLRYRIGQGEIHWFFDLYRWEVAVREAVVSALDRAASETGLPAYEGQPEAGS
jgi:uncharacterized protein YfdQ (DUF2303 family)